MSTGKTIIDVITVWIVTAVANIIGFFSGDFLKILPIIQLLLGIFSILLAILYTLYKFASNWKGLAPWKRMDKEIKQNTEDIKTITKDISDINKK